MIDFALYLGYALVLIAAIAAVVMPLISSLSDPKSLAKTGMGLGALLVIFFIGYLFSGSEVTPVYTQFGVDAGLSKFIGGMVTMMYLLIAIVGVAIVYGEVSKLFK